MGTSLIFALGLAGLALLVFGERLGLPASMAAAGVTGILAFMGLGIALTSTTSRLRTFLATRNGNAFWGSACVCAMIFVLILSLAIPPGAVGVAGMTAFLGGLFLAKVLAPSQSAEGRYGRADSTRMIAILTALAALHLVVMLWPHVLREVSAATGWDAGTARLAVLLLAGLPAILGGLDGLMRLSVRILMLCIVLCLLPFLFESIRTLEWIRQISPDIGLSLLSGMIRDMLSRPLPPLADLGASLPALMQAPNLILTGMLAGLALRMSDAAMPLRSQRFFAPLLGLAIAAGFMAAAGLTRMHLDTVLLPSLSRLSPAEWPLFAFDPSLQGWLSVCGRAPRDAVDIAQACGSSTSPALDRFVLDRQLALPAVAASAGWPLLLGTVWNLAIPLFLTLGTGLLVHAAASGISENLLFHFLHPRALRAWRLAMARAVALVILAGLCFDPWMEDRLSRTLALGIIILLAASITSTWLRITIKALVRLSGPRPTTPDPAPAVQ